MMAHEHLAFLQGRGFGDDELEVVHRGFALRAAREQDLRVAWHDVLLMTII
jgi:hypothetical protein